MTPVPKRWYKAWWGTEHWVEECLTSQVISIDHLYHIHDSVLLTWVFSWFWCLLIYLRVSLSWREGKKTSVQRERRTHQKREQGPSFNQSCALKAIPHTLNVSQFRSCILQRTLSARPTEDAVFVGRAQLKWDGRVGHNKTILIPFVFLTSVRLTA